MKKVMSVSVEERVIELAKEAAHELRVSVSSFVEGAIRARVESKTMAPESEGTCDYCKKRHDLRVVCPEYKNKLEKVRKRLSAADRIREKLSRKPIEDVPRETKISEEDEELLRGAQDRIQKKREVKAGYFNPQPKKGK